MKVLLFAAILSTTFIGNALAENRSLAREGNSIALLSHDAERLANILLNSQLTECLEDLHRVHNDTSINRITSETVGPQTTVFVLEGLIQSLDVVIGKMKVEIVETIVEDPFRTLVPTYKCSVQFVD